MSDDDKEVISVQQKKFNTALKSTIANYIVYSAWTLLNKELFKLFPFPLAATSIEMFVAALCTYTTVTLTGMQRQYPSVQLWKRKVVPLCVSRSIDIGCGNFALLYLAVAYQQVLKATIPVFVCLLEAFWVGKHVSLGVWFSMLPIVGGSLVSTLGEAKELVLFGLGLQVASCIGRSLKCVINGLLMTPLNATEEQLDPYHVLLYEAPTSGILVGVLALIVEGRGLQTFLLTATFPTISKFLLGSVVCGALMFGVQISYLHIIHSTTPITCQVLMNFKMLLLIMLAFGFTAHTPVTPVKILGIAITIGGGFLYSLILARNAARENKGNTASTKEDETPPPPPPIKPNSNSNDGPM